ncbi:MAG: family 16 glycoside hydrolase [Candidatus Aminicenantales bacterium]
MNKRAFVFPLLIILLVCPPPSAPQASTISAKVSRILVQFPAPGPAEKVSLAAEVFNLGEAGIEEICRRLSPPGKADDSLARFALDAAGTYAMRPGGEKERSVYARAIIRALKNTDDPGIQVFLIGRLQQAGGRESVEPLSRFLSDPRLADPAAQALLSIRAPGEEEAFIKALGRSKGPNTVTLIKALGELQSRKAVSRIITFASSDQRDIRDAGLFALANIGDPRTEFALSRIDIASSPLEKAEAAARYLLFARRLAEDGRKEEGFRIARSLLEKNRGAGESQVRSAALTLAAQILGADALPELVRAMASPDPAFRGRALEIALQIPGEEATMRFVAKAAEVPPGARAQIIEMLGRREDQTARAFVERMLRDDDKAVRIAAIEASARLGGSEASGALSPLWPTAGEEEAEALKKAFLSFPAEKALPGVVSAFDTSSPAAQTAIIEILGERRARDQAGIVLAAAENEDESVRKKALAALEAVVRGQDLQETIRLLQAAAEPAEIVSLQSALVASAREIPDPEKRADLIVESMLKSKGQQRIALLRPLAGIGGQKALESVIAETKSRDPQVQAAAVYTLANWPEFRAAGTLLEMAKSASSSPSRKFVYLALQGYVRLAAASAEPAEKKLALIKEALAIALQPAEKNIVLEGLAKIRTRESLLMIKKFLAEPTFREKAAREAAKCALPAPGYEGMPGFDAARILKQAALSINNEYDRGQVEKYAHILFLQEGFVPLFNGKDLSGWKGLVKDPPARAKMTLKELEKEQKVADEDMRKHWRVVDGTLVFDGQGHSLCTAKDYAGFELFVDWKIETGGDSGIYLRGSPQVQIWDPAQWPEGSGGLYNNKQGPSKPLRPADRPVGEWNTFFIRMEGERVTVHLNGILVVDDVAMENYWERDNPIYPAGQIEIQAHSTPLYFKNIYLREIPE